MIPSDAAGDVNRRGKRVFEICQEVLFWASNLVLVFRIFDRVWAFAPKIAKHNCGSRRSRPACVKPFDLSRTNDVRAPETVMPDCVFWVYARFCMPQMESLIYSKIRYPGTRGQPSDASPNFETRQTQNKAACRPSSYMGSHITNEIYRLGRRRPAPHADIWSLSRHESGTDWQEGDSSPPGGAIN